MADVTLDDMMKKMKQLELLMAEAAAESDPEKALILAQRLAAEGQALEAMGEKLREQTKAPGMAGTIEVVLTPDQKARVKEKTGVTLETIRIPDEVGALNQSMPVIRPSAIEPYAMAEAERRAAQAEADQMIRTQLGVAIAEIEAQENPELSDQLKTLLQDPKMAAALGPAKK
jgi:hypothetical protein